MQTPILPSDAKSYTICKRRVWLDNQSEIPLVEIDDPFELLIIEMGNEHERDVLERLKHLHEVQHAESIEHTRQLMAENVPVIYQARLQDDKLGVLGFPDFLIHTEDGYRPADAKLASTVHKKEIQIQLGCYRRLLDTPLSGLVFLGDGTESEVGEEADALTDRFLSDMRALLTSNDEPRVRYSHSKCRSCPYYSRCAPRFEEQDELSLLYGVQGRAADGLEEEGVDSILALARSDPNTLPDVPYLKGFENKQRAVLQAKSSITNEVFQVSDILLPQGTWVHFDIEDNPLTPSGEKHVYLWGFLVPGEQFECVWTNSEDADREGWLSFLDKIDEYRKHYPSLVLAHYSPHERTTIRQYADRYDMKDHPTAEYLLSDEGPLFDMLKPVKKSLVLPLQGYGLKDVCKHKDLVNFQWQDEESGSQWSVVQFKRFLTEADAEKREQLKAEILRYNHDDVLATRRLEGWLKRNFVS